MEVSIVGFFELFSVRNNPKVKSDVFKYEKVDQKCRIQINFILQEIIPPNKVNFESIWKNLGFNLCKELGVMNLGAKYTAYGNVTDYLIGASDKDYIDALDYIIYFIHNSGENFDRAYRDWDIRNGLEIIAWKVKEINFRLRQHSIGYEAIEGRLVRIDNQYIHNEVVKNAIQLLYDMDFKSVTDEFLKAHEHYKQGDYKDAVVNAGKAFESTMKTICSKNGYNYDAQRDTANTLIRHLFDNGLIPSYMQTHFQGLRQALENSAHVLRNKNGGHGQGDVIVDVDDSIVRYTLNMCATNIVFLVERYKETK